jgi:diadenosine tetraphosphatase ApaH/serine/threonine PP2A family protein phosphatase
MKILIISDIHANLTALEAVLEDAGEFEAVWFLGDLVGYGPDPNECVERVRDLPGLVSLLGNHDAATLNQIEIVSFNPDARRAVLWTQSVISPENLEYLAEIPETAQIGDVTLAHGSPRQPVWEYLLDSYTVTENFDFFDTPFCFVGHTHLPVVYHLDDQHLLAERTIPEPDMQLTLTPRLIINPGSVGQPRDRNPRAAYALFDSETNHWQFKRVPYDIKSVQKRMRRFDLPQRHINRLELGW